MQRDCLTAAGKGGAVATGGGLMAGGVAANRRTTLEDIHCLLSSKMAKTVIMFHVWLLQEKTVIIFHRWLLQEKTACKPKQTNNIIKILYGRWKE